jgi:hypothetical protein
LLSALKVKRECHSQNKYDLSYMVDQDNDTEHTRTYGRIYTHLHLVSHAILLFFFYFQYHFTTAPYSFTHLFVTHRRYTNFATSSVTK